MSVFLEQRDIEPEKILIQQQPPMLEGLIDRRTYKIAPAPSATSSPWTPNWSRGQSQDLVNIVKGFLDICFRYLRYRHDQANSFPILIVLQGAHYL
ncbi:hypothetical protein RBB73_07570 [Tunturiibacter empetritectus]|uniref:hypothetical protein n=1 Tax=Tunturiibacter empetritectus TaxID=3069691 RepID=UPI003D9AC985